jgi:aldose 1-epimerase
MRNIKTVLAGMGIAAILSACASGEQKALTVSGLDPAKFDTLINEKPVKLYTLVNKNGVEACITNFGGRLVSLMVPDREGKLTDVVLGYDNIAQYADAKNFGSDFGASIGRYANRIKNGQFCIGDSTIQLPQNNFGHCLHGGPTGWQYQIFDAEQIDPTTLKLTLVSPDGDNNFPGQVTATVTYTLTDDNAIDIKMEAETDKPTVVNLTNHVYLNLDGEASGSVLSHKLELNASEWLPTDETLIPLGAPEDVAGTPMDFVEAKVIGEDIKADFPALNYGKGYDNCWVIDGYEDGDLHQAAVLCDPVSGRMVEISTDQPAAQVYTGNWLEGCPMSKSGKQYHDYDGVAIECQGMPDAPNHDNFPSQVLRPDEEYRRIILFDFKTN